MTSGLWINFGVVAVLMCVFPYCFPFFQSFDFDDVVDVVYVVWYGSFDGGVFDCFFSKLVGRFISCDSNMAGYPDDCACASAGV